MSYRWQRVIYQYRVQGMSVASITSGKNGVEKIDTGYWKIVYQSQCKVTYIL